MYRVIGWHTHGTPNFNMEANSLWKKTDSAHIRWRVGSDPMNRALANALLEALKKRAREGSTSCSHLGSHALLCGEIHEGTRIMI